MRPRSRRRLRRRRASTTVRPARRRLSDSTTRGSRAPAETSKESSDKRSPSPLALMHASLRAQNAAKSAGRADSSAERSARSSPGVKKRRAISASRARVPIDSMSTPTPRPVVTATSARFPACDTLNWIPWGADAGASRGFPCGPYESSILPGSVPVYRERIVRRTPRAATNLVR